MNRLRNAWHALFARNPSITVDVVGDTWRSCEWRGMDRDRAVAILGDVHDRLVITAFAQMPCSATVH
jgi:hypothetical protein